MKSMNRFSITNLAKNPEYFDDVLDLIEREFHYPEDKSFEVDFYPLMNSSNFEHCHVLIDTQDNTVVGHIGVCLRNLQHQNTKSPIALIGGVCVESNYQGMGLFKHLIQHVIQHYQDKVALFLLWSDKSDLYRKMDFYEAGAYFQTGNKDFSSSLIPTTFIHKKLTQLNLSEKDQIKVIYSNFILKKFWSIERTNKDWENIFQMDSVDGFFRYHEDNITDYFFAHKGHDLQGIIHEFGTKDLNSYPSLLEKISEFKTWLPFQEASSVKDYPEVLYYSAHFKVGNTNLFNLFLNDWSQGKLQVRKIDNLFHFYFDGHPYELTQEQLIQGLFGPNLLEEFSSFGGPIFIAGTDSI